MNVIKLTFSISLSFFILFLNFNNGKKTYEKKNVNLIKKNDCGIESVTLKTERTSKKRKFHFWKLRHKKVIIFDQVLDSNNNIIFERKSVFICSMDACDDRKYRRIKIMNNEIWVYGYGKNYENKYIKRYDFCGKYLREKDWTKNDFFND